MYLGVRAAAESCSVCAIGRALQGQYILSAPHCQLLPSQLHWCVAPQSTQSPASSVQCILHHTFLGSLHCHAECVLEFTAYFLVRFNLSSSLLPFPRIYFPLCAFLL